MMSSPAPAWGPGQIEEEDLNTDDGSLLATAIGTGDPVTYNTWYYDPSR